MNLRDLIGRVLGRKLKRFLRDLWRLQFRNFISQEDLHFLAPSETYSKTEKKWNTEINIGAGGWWSAENHSHGFHGLLIQYWEQYGLGMQCLLVSENDNVKQQFIAKYSDVTFHCTDYYTELYSDKQKTDVVWSLYEEPPGSLPKGSFDSIICQATFEHLMDPVGVIRRLASLVKDYGFIYIHTHTPGYRHHPCPKDYIRLFPGWFKDINMLIENLDLLELHADQGHVFCVYQVCKPSH